MCSISSFYLVLLWSKGTDQVCRPEELQAYNLGENVVIKTLSPSFSATFCFCRPSCLLHGWLVVPDRLVSKHVHHNVPTIKHIQRHRVCENPRRRICHACCPKAEADSGQMTFMLIALLCRGMEAWNVKFPHSFVECKLRPLSCVESFKSLHMKYSISLNRASQLLLMYSYVAGRKIKLLSPKKQESWKFVVLDDQASSGTTK